MQIIPDIGLYCIELSILLPITYEDNSDNQFTNPTDAIFSILI